MYYEFKRQGNCFGSFGWAPLSLIKTPGNNDFSDFTRPGFFMGAGGGGPAFCKSRFLLAPLLIFTI